MDFTNERKCIHDMANHLTIIQGVVRKTMKELVAARVLPAEIDRLAKADDYLKQSIAALKELRQTIIEKSEASP